MAFTKAQWRQVLINAKGAIKGGNTPRGLDDTISPFTDLPQVHLLDLESPAKWRRLHIQQLYFLLPGAPGPGEVPFKWLRSVVNELNRTGIQATFEENEWVPVEIEEALELAGSASYEDPTPSAPQTANVSPSIATGVIFNAPIGSISTDPPLLHGGILTYLTGLYGALWPTGDEDIDVNFIAFNEGLNNYISQAQEQITTTEILADNYTSWLWEWDWTAVDESLNVFSDSGSQSGSIAYVETVDGTISFTGDNTVGFDIPHPTLDPYTLTFNSKFTFT